MATGTGICAWTLLPNPFHLLVRSGPLGLPVFMRRWLTGYAITQYRRHRRVGHLLRIRYRSIVVDEDTYYQELVRYLHRNPLLAEVAKTLVADVGLSRAEVARRCGVTTSAISRAIRRTGTGKVAWE